MELELDLSDNLSPLNEEWKKKAEKALRYVIPQIVRNDAERKEAEAYVSETAGRQSSEPADKPKRT